MMEIKIITNRITLAEVKQIAADSYGDMVKAVVDIERGIIAIGGEWHADAESALLENGSTQTNLWGINIYPDKSPDGMIAFVSLINIRPRQNNRGMEIQDPFIKNKITAIVNKLISI
ncbi:MAG: DUF5674 family protein [Candidatus Doudnabacteria bacterium]|nr:DUF5674 family protein [Candidatus Doudnabacteria bacterium]